MAADELDRLPPIQGGTALDPALTARIAARLAADLRPVRPVPSTEVTVAALFAAFAASAAAGAAVLGFFGVERLGAGPIALIFPALFGLALLSAAAAANALAPGSRRPFHPAWLMAAGCAVMAAIFVFVFPDRTAGRFVPEGIACLRAGLIWSIPAGAAGWLILRRGFAVDRSAAGIAAGAAAGMAGLAMLELHCPNFRLPHVAVWHLAVVPCAALAGWAIYFFGSKRKAAELMQ